MPAAALKPVACRQKLRLHTAVLAAIEEVKRLHEAEIEAALEGKTRHADFGRFDAAIELASKRRVMAKAALLQHLAEHNC